MHPKAMYQVTKDGMQEKTAMSFDEEWALAKQGWYPHPEEARIAGPKEAKPERKPIADMDKAELEEFGRTLGVELDRRKTRANMLKDLEGYLQ